MRFHTSMLFTIVMKLERSYNLIKGKLFTSLKFKGIFKSFINTKNIKTWKPAFYVLLGRKQSYVSYQLCIKKAWKYMSK